MRQLLVYGEKTFKITVPDDAKITFGPFSPPSKADNFGRTRGFNPIGTLRVYKGTKDNIIACFSNVESFRDLSMDYAEEIAVEEGASIWKSDQEGYVREDKVQRTNEWIEPELPAIAPPKRNGKTKRAKSKT